MPSLQVCERAKLLYLVVRIIQQVHKETKTEAGGRKTHIGFHDRGALCAYGTTSMVPLTPTVFLERSMPILGNGFDIRAF